MINRYTCEACGKSITTVDRADGVTSMFLMCRATPECFGRMVSAMYQCDQTLTPGWEWYRPKRVKGDRGLREHVRAGGLVIRRIEQE